jgi:hypothetical protein
VTEEPRVGEIEHRLDAAVEEQRRRERDNGAQVHVPLSACIELQGRKRTGLQGMRCGVHGIERDLRGQYAVAADGKGADDTRNPPFVLSPLSPPLATGGEENGLWSKELPPFDKGGQGGFIRSRHGKSNLP